MDCMLCRRNSRGFGRYRRRCRSGQYWHSVCVRPRFARSDFSATQTTRSQASLPRALCAMVPANLSSFMRRIDVGAYADYMAALCDLVGPGTADLRLLQPPSQRVLQASSVSESVMKIGPSGDPSFGDLTSNPCPPERTQLPAMHSSEQKPLAWYL